MTTEEAVDRLIKLYNAPESWREHFMNVVLRFTGGSGRLDSTVFSMIREYLNNLT